MFFTEPTKIIAMLNTGLDVIFDDGLVPYVMEINEGPDMVCHSKWPVEMQAELARGGAATMLEPLLPYRIEESRAGQRRVDNYGWATIHACTCNSVARRECKRIHRLAHAQAKSEMMDQVAHWRR